MQVHCDGGVDGDAIPTSSEMLNTCDREWGWSVSTTEAMHTLVNGTAGYQQVPACPLELPIHGQHMHMMTGHMPAARPHHCFCLDGVCACLPPPLLLQTLLPLTPTGELCDLDGNCVDAAEDEIFKLTTQVRRDGITLELHPACHVSADSETADTPCVEGDHPDPGASFHQSCPNLLPAFLPFPRQFSRHFHQQSGQLRVEREKVTIETPELDPSLIFEQDPVQILDALLPLYMNSCLLRSLQEALASELAARMNAMNSATDNAKELSKVLLGKYNRARQAKITQVRETAW